MNVRHKYAHNGGWLFENAEELMIDDNFPEIPLGQIGGINGWFLTMKEDFKNSNFYYYAYIETTNEKPRLKCDYYFNICKNNGSAVFPNKGSCYLNSDQVPEGKPIMDDEWLKEENKYLMNGGIMIEYGFQIEGVLNEDDIWTFNFHDRLFECEEKRNMITFLDNKPFYSHKQLLTFHSTYFNSNSNENLIIKLTFSNYFEKFLQLSHGVRALPPNLLQFYHALKYAQKYKLHNVIQLLDQLIVSNEWYSEALLSQAILYDLRHYLADFLKKQKTSKELAEKLKKVKINKMIGEAMKKCVKRFLEF